MCYYNGQRVTRAEFIELKKLEKAVKNYDFLDTGIHNGFTYPPCAIAVATDDRRDFELMPAQWGYVPGKMSTEEALAFRRKLTTLNFKGENLWKSEKGSWSMWADAAKKRRCLVLSTGIVESRHIPKIGRKWQPLKETIKYPYMIGMKDREYFWLPGLYSDWFNPNTGETRRTFALGITQANELMKQIHNSKLRMPAILTEDLAWEWLMEDPSQDRLTEIAMTQVPSKLLEACTISPEYRTLGETATQEYPELPVIDQTFIDQEKLDFDHWAA